MCVCGYPYYYYTTLLYSYVIANHLPYHDIFQGSHKIDFHL